MRVIRSTRSPSPPPSSSPMTRRLRSFVSFIPSLRSSRTALKPLVVFTNSSFSWPQRFDASCPAWEFFPSRRLLRSSVRDASSSRECNPSIFVLILSTSASDRSFAASSANMRFPPVLTSLDSSASRVLVVETSLDISEAVILKFRSSARAGFCCCCCLAFCGLIVADASPDVCCCCPSARRELISLCGTARARAMNSAVLSAMVSNETLWISPRLPVAPLPLRSSC
mmetsp:Transcript_23008/g.52160  ORF Transcript_23008/g.52160 Transcript_23008/m.52160 type:complete len:227 (-) Transcript_23008:47-727(-)